jgi:predicted  nucleic acid-binding Zn-ribbon protein
MMEPTNVTIEILKSIRDEMRGVRGEVVAVRNEVAAVREQHVRSEIRVATELVAVAGEFRALREDLHSAGLRARLDDHEQRIEALENRTE